MFFYRQSSAVAASRTIGGVTYTANVAGSAGNSIAITHTPASDGSAGTKASVVITNFSGSGSSSVTVTAKNVGTAGNRLRITFSNLGAAGSAATYTVGASKDVISVPGTGSVRMSDLRNSLLLSPASTYVDVSTITNVGIPPTGSLNKFMSYDLINGSNSTPAETTAVIVGANDPNATAITVRIASADNVETVAGIVNAASSSVSASGTGSVTDRNTTLLLQSGAD